MEIKVKDKKLSVTTTDNVNYLVTTSTTEVNQPDFECVVRSKMFASLVSKITTDSITLSIEDDNLIIKGNGTYKMKVETDSDGSAISIQVPEFEASYTSYHISPTDINDILRIGFVCKAENKEFPAIFNFYADSKNVLSTNQYKGCMLPVPMFDVPTALPPKIMTLVPCVSVVDSKDPNVLDGVDVLANDKAVVFESALGRLYGPKCSDTEADSYPAEGLKEVVKSPNLPIVNVIRTMLFNAVDRMFLFSNADKHNKLKFTFSDEKLTITNETTSEEEVAYTSTVSAITEPVVVFLDSKDLLSILSMAPENLNIQASQDGIYIDIGPYSALALSCVEDDEENTEA